MRNTVKNVEKFDEGGCSLSERNREKRAQDFSGMDKTFHDLPLEVVQSTLVKFTDVRDVAACILSCKFLGNAALNAPLKVRVPAPAPSKKDNGHTSRVLHSVVTQMKGVVELDLSGCPIDDNDLCNALVNLRRLQTVDVSGCTKLSLSIPELILTPRPVTSAPSAISNTRKLTGSCGIQAVNLQRCFQLTDCALTDAIKAAMSDTSQLKGVSFCKLNLSDWPVKSGSSFQAASYEKFLDSVLSEERRLSPRLTDNQIAQSSKLRVLVLHNCGKISSYCLEAIAELCPNLGVLCLGGCVVDPTTPGGDNFEIVCRDILEKLDACDLGVDDNRKGVCVNLLALIVRLKKLWLLELTFFPPKVKAYVRWALGEGHIVDLGDRMSDIQILDMCERESVRLASVIGHEISKNGWNDSKFNGISGATFNMALKGSVNCSLPGSSGLSMFSHTPLHTASEEGDAHKVEELIKLGAGLDLKGRGGATPLFLACFSGHVDVALALLKNSANGTKGNKNEETPLYIAALRGHLQVVDVLLSYFEWQGVNWRDSRVYGDGWTPLMAAAVADRCDVARCLLHAAGPGASSLCCMVNKHGQTALHIAAYRGCIQMIQVLVEVGGGPLVTKNDAYRRSALDVAKAKNHRAAVGVLMRSVKKKPQRVKGGAFILRWDAWMHNGMCSRSYLDLIGHAVDDGG